MVSLYAAEKRKGDACFLAERQTIRVWLEQLHRMDANSEEMTLRNDYMWFLLLMLQNKKLSAPFDHMPPRELRPIRDIVVSSFSNRKIKIGII